MDAIKIKTICDLINKTILIYSADGTKVECVFVEHVSDSGNAIRTSNPYICDSMPGAWRITPPLYLIEILSE
jgi:hypothetical protein